MPIMLYSYPKLIMTKTTITSLLATLPQSITCWHGRSATHSLLPNNALFIVKRRHINEIVNVHHRYVLAFILSEDARIVVDGQWETLFESSCRLFPPFQAHGFGDHVNVEHLYFTFECECDQFTSLRNQSLSMTEEIRRWLGKAMMAYSERSELGSTRCLCYMELLLEEMLSLAEDMPNPQRDVSHDPLISGVMDYVFKNLSSELKIETIARVCGSSASHLRLRFREHMRVSLGRWIKQVRMGHGRSLLLSTKRSVKEITYLCGYRSQARFSANFKAMFGTSPKTYRMKHGKFR